MTTNDNTKAMESGKCRLKLAWVGTSSLLAVSLTIHTFAENQHCLEFDSHDNPHTEDERAIQEQFQRDSVFLSGTGHMQFTPINVDWSLDSSRNSIVQVDLIGVRRQSKTGFAA